MEQNHDMDEIDLLELARLLWSHALQIAAAGIAAAVICLLVCTFVLTPRYQASVNLIVNSRQDGNASITSDNINSARNLIDTYAVIIKSNIVLNDVIEQLGLDMTYRQLLACISVDGVGSTQIMSITVTNEDPALAGKIVQAIAETAPDVIVDKVEAVDPLTVRFTLKQPTAGFIARLSNGTASMVCPSLLKKAAAAGDAAAAKKVTAYEACGTGPYTLKHFEPTEVLEVVKNPNYRVAGLPKFDSLRWVPVAENSTRAMMLRTGEAQFIWPVPAEQVKALEADDKLSIQKTPSVVTRYISMNETKKPFNDVRVRKAISLAINRNALIKVAYNGLAVPSTGYLPPQIEGAVNYGPFPYDPKAARELLKEAGFPEGFHATLWSAYNDGKTLKTLQFLQQQLAQVGIHVETRALEAGQRSLIYSAQTPADSQHQLYLIGWTNSAAEPDWGLRPLLDSRSAPPVLNK